MTPKKRIPIACTLPPDAAHDQLEAWAQLRQRARAVTEISGGLRLHLPADAHASAVDLAAREMACCAFLTITVDEHPDGAVLDITSEDPDGRRVIDLLGGRGS